ncbi:hypothetical protein [Modestobacter sp. I12A-02662]|uniref:hypothetical protein n=1 Tax=Modestobacter sp. I12A-02662 TaxID=1730496 RepID=UPI0034DFEA84
MTADERAARPRTGTAPDENVASRKPLNDECTAAENNLILATLADLSRAVRDAGVAAANGNQDHWWASCCDAAIRYLAALDRPFTADDVQALIPTADHPCRMGGRFYAAIRAGIIRPVGYTLSERPSRRRGVLRLYQRGVAG